MPDRLSERYELLDEPRGRHGFSRVCRAIDRKSGREVAVTVLETSEPRIREAFLWHADALGKVHHPNVVNVIDMGFLEENGVSKPFAVRPWLHGVTLEQLVAIQGPLSLSKAVEITTEVCGALDFLHDLGVAHADVGLASIQIDEDASVKLTDLTGYSRDAIPGETAPSDILRANGCVAADVSDVAAAIYGMLCGPMVEATLAVRPALHELNPAVSEQLSLMIEAAMDASHRPYSTAAEFAQSLSSAVSEQRPEELRELKERRYQELVDKKFLEGLSHPEQKELGSLFGELSEYDEAFYRPVLRDLRERKHEREP
jgi:serine/threonine protein kinase